MSNVGIARQAFEDLKAFMRGDLPGESFAQLLDPEIEWHWDGKEHPSARPLRGKRELIEFLEQSRGAWVDLATEPREFIAAPDGRVLVYVHQAHRGWDDGASIVDRYFELWTIRNGKVRKVEIFRNRADALEAAGLRE